MTEKPPSREVALDAALIAVFPAILVAIYFLVPRSLQIQLALDHSDLQLYTIFTSTFVHAGWNHLLNNVVGYLLAVLYAYMLCLFVDRRRWFRRTTVLLVLVLPIVVGTANYLIFATYFPQVDGLSRGFSGVVGGFGGFLLVAFAVAIKDAYDTNTAQLVGTALVLLLLLEIEFVYGGAIRPVVGTLAIAGIVLEGVAYLYERNWELPSIESSSDVLAKRVAGGVLVVVVLSYLVVNLFPAELVQGGALVNVFAHGIGFLCGMILSLGMAYLYQ